MKVFQILSTILIFGMSASFAQDPHADDQPYVTAPPNGPQENAGTLQAISDAFNYNDISVYQQLISDDIPLNEWVFTKLTGMKLYPMPNDMVFATGCYKGKDHKKTVQAAHHCWFKTGTRVRFRQFADVKITTDPITE